MDQKSGGELAFGNEASENAQKFFRGRSMSRSAEFRRKDMMRPKHWELSPRPTIRMKVHQIFKHDQMNEQQKLHRHLQTHSQKRTRSFCVVALTEPMHSPC